MKSPKHQKILLTGASGFIGSHVLEELLQRGYNVHVVVHCRKVSGHPSVTLHQLDLFDNAATEKLMSEQRFTHLLHLAWYMGAGAHVHNLNMTWLASSIRLLESFAHYGGTHFLGAGTCAEYEYKYGLMREDDTPTTPSSLYGCCKNAFYRSARLFCALNDIHFQWIRPFNCYGPGDRGSYRLIPSVIADCLRGDNVRVSECKNYKDFVYVKDAVRGIVDVVESPLSGAVNMCSGQPVQLRTIVDKIAELTHFKGNILWGALPGAAENELVVGDNRKLRSIGWFPQYDLMRGLRETISSEKEYS